MSNLDSSKIRGLLTFLVFVFRFGLTIYLAFVFSAEVFEKIFAHVSLMSAVFIFMSASNVNVKNFLLQRQGDFSIVDGISYIRAFEIVIASLFFVFAMIFQYHIVAVMIVLIRFSATMKELEAEVVNKRYALIFQVVGEVLLLFLIFLHYKLQSIWIVLPLILLVHSWVHFAKGGDFGRAVSLFKIHGLKKEGLLLEFNGMILYGLDLFIMSLFLSPSQFIIYFFIQRVFGSLNIMHGLLSRNLWSQAMLGGLSEQEAATKSNNDYLNIFFIIGFLAFVGIVSSVALSNYWTFNSSMFDLSFLNAMDTSFFIEATCLSVLGFIFQSMNRYQKNKFSISNRLFSLAIPNAFLAVIYGCVIAILWYFKIDWLYIMVFKISILLITFKVNSNLYIGMNKSTIG